MAAEELKLLWMPDREGLERCRAFGMKLAAKLQ
jgi:hypothetical protein